MKTSLIWLAELAAAVNQVIKSARESEEWGAQGPTVEEKDFEQLKTLSESLKQNALNIEEGAIIFTSRDHPEADGRIPQAEDVGFDLSIPLEGSKTLIVRVGREAMRNLLNVFQAQALADAGHAPGGNNGTCPECHGNSFHIAGEEWRCDFCHWNDQPPTSEGAWWLMSDECGEAMERVNVFYKDGEFWGEGPDVGRHPIQTIQDGLIHPRWKRVNS